MEANHTQALRAFARRLAILLMLRQAAVWTAAWLSLWGVVVPAGRVAGVVGGDWLLLGILGSAPLAVVAALREWRRCPPCPGPASDFRSGKAAALNFLKGQVMKLSKGKANPAIVGEILERKLRT